MIETDRPSRAIHRHNDDKANAQNVKRPLSGERGRPDLAESKAGRPEMSAEARLDAPQAARLADVYRRSTGIPCVVIDAKGGLVHPSRLRDYPCRLCRLVYGSVDDRTRIAKPHLRFVRDALRFGGKLEFICSSGFMHWTVPIVMDGVLVGALVAGPVRIDAEDQPFEEAVLARMAGEVARNQVTDLRKLFDAIPKIDTGRVSALCDLLFELAGGLNRAAMPQFAESARRLARETRLNEYVHEINRRRATEEMVDRPSYPAEKEQALTDAVSAGDVEAAQAALNELLTYAFFSLGATIESVRLRIRELVVLMSRIVISHGADADEVFGMHYQFLDGLEEQHDIHELAHWTARIVRRFADHVIMMPREVVHVGALRRAVAFIHQAAPQGISLDAAAKVAGMAPTYFSRVFRREMGESFSTFVSRVRVRKAQELLRTTRIAIGDIAELSGFSDQSHLTRVFRNFTGTTPARYRRGEGAMLAAQVGV